MIPWAANWTACWEEPHWRSMVVAGTSSGSPAASQALRATFTDCSPIWDTQPMITSSTSTGSTPPRSTSARSTTAPRSTACTPASPPVPPPHGRPPPPHEHRLHPRLPFPHVPPLPHGPLDRRWHRPPRPSTRRGAGWPGAGLLGLLDHHPFEAQLLDRPVARVTVDGGDGVDHVHPLDDLAEDGVLPVQPGCRRLGDEELGPVGVGPGVGHGQE